jgi:hypothetical protein
MVHADADFSGDSNNDQVQTVINEGRFEFAENPQMELDEDPLQVNMNMVKLNGKKVLLQPSQAELTKGKKVVIGEERQPRMIRPKNSEIGRWKKNERSKLRSRPKGTFDILIAKYRDGKAGIRNPQSWTIRFPKPDHPISLYQVSTFVALKLIQQPIQGTVAAKFRRSGSSSTRASSDALLPDRATNA